MIRKVTVTNHVGESIELELRFPEKSGFLVRGIEGLGPPKATINTTEIAMGDGSVYNSARSNSRNILLSLGFIGTPRIEDTRHLSYKYFPLKKKIKIRIETDTRISEIYGYVESNEPEIFSDKEGAIISVLCPVPYLTSIDKDIYMFTGIDSLFEFPFSNESLTEKLLLMSNIEDSNLKSIEYLGDATTGFIMRLHAIGPVVNLVIAGYSSNELVKIDHVLLQSMTGMGIVAGDTIVISSIFGEKTMTLIRGGLSINILNALGESSSWLELEPGLNVFEYTATSGIEYIDEFSIETSVLYEGV